MKTIPLLFLILFLILPSIDSTAQDQQGQWTLGADLLNRYNWRGTDYGNSPVIQPSLKYSFKGFSAGAWANYSLSSNTGSTEADLILSYAFPWKISLGITDYYFPFEPGSEGHFFEYNRAHLFETTLSKSFGKLNLSGNWLFANANNDLYFEAQYAFKSVGLFAGAGNNSYTINGDYNLVNVGLTAAKSIQISDKFALPFSGKFILNPDKEQIFLVFGVTF